MQQNPHPGPSRVPGRLVTHLPPAFHYPAYRAYWLGMLGSVAGFQVFRFAQAWLVYELTGSALYLGYTLAANALPGIFFNLFGGVFADKLNKRILIVTTQTVTALLIFALGGLTLLDLVQIWHILVIAFLAGAAEAFDTPARQALYPHLIDRKVMTSAVALNSSIWQGTRIVAPAIAGVLIDMVNTGSAFILAGAGFVVMAVVMASLRLPPIPAGAPGNPARALLDGVTFIGRNGVFSFLIAMTFFNSFFGNAYVLLMPVFAVDVLEVGARGQGFLLMAGGVGSLATTIWVGARGGVRRRGLFIIGGAVVFGLGVAAFGVTAHFLRSYPLALALIGLIGCCNSVYMISIQSSLQLLVPDNMRGRVMGFYGMTWSIMPLGGLQAGALASIAFIGAPFAVAIGGVAVAAAALGPVLMSRRIRNIVRQLQPPAADREAADTLADTLVESPAKPEPAPTPAAPTSSGD